MTQEQEYLSAIQAAQYLGVNRQRVYELAAAGHLGRRLAGYWVFTRAELDAYRQERTFRPKGGRPKSDAPRAGRVVGATTSERPQSRKPRPRRDGSTPAPALSSGNSVLGDLPH